MTFKDIVQQPVSVAKALLNRRQRNPQPCDSEVIPVGDWVIVALPQGLFEGVLKSKNTDWGFAIVEIEYSAYGYLHHRRVRVWEADLRRMSCWLQDEAAAPHLVDNYLW